MFYEEIDVRIFKNSSLLDRNRCFYEGGGLNFITKKSDSFHLFSHVGFSVHCTCNFKTCSIVIIGEIM